MCRPPSGHPEIYMSSECIPRLPALLGLGLTHQACRPPALPLEVPGDPALGGPLTTSPVPLQVLPEACLAGPCVFR